MVQFLNQNAGVSFQYPETWTLDATQSREDNVTFILMLTPKNSEGAPVRHNINLVFEEMGSNPLSLSEYTDAGLAREREFFAEFTLLLRDTRVIAGHEAAFVRFDANYGGISLRYEQAWFLRGNEAVVWTLAADEETFDQSSTVFKALLESLVTDVR